MNVLIVPSWYPTESFPIVGIFFREQARLIAEARPDWNVGISLWGSHEPKLWVHRTTPLDSLIKLGSKPPLKPYDNPLQENCVEFFTPAFTWTRRIRKGNMKGITRANLNNLNRFESHFGSADVIHAHVSYPGGAIAKNLSGIKQIPYVITEHMSPFPAPDFKHSAKKYLIPALKSASQVLSVGRKLSEELASFGIASVRTKNFVDLEGFTLSDQKPSEIRVFTLGRLEAQKNHQLLISALARIRHKPWHLTIGGDGGELSRLKKLATKLGLTGRVDFLGSIDQSEVIDQMKQASFFVLPSAHESFGVAALEAMACGKPVIITNTGGIDELLPDFVGLVIGTSEEELVAALTTMMDTYPQYEASQIRDFVVKEFSPDVVCTQLEEVYQEAISSRQ